MDFTIDFDEIDKAVLIKVSGDIDAYHSATFKKKLLSKMEETEKEVMIIEMSRVSYIDSAGLGSMVSSIKEARKNSKRIVLVGLQPQIKKIFSMTKLDKIIDIKDTVEEV